MRSCSSRQDPSKRNEPEYRGLYLLFPYFCCNIKLIDGELERNKSLTPPGAVGFLWRNKRASQSVDACWLQDQSFGISGVFFWLRKPRRVVEWPLLPIVYRCIQSIYKATAQHR